MGAPLALLALAHLPGMPNLAQHYMLKGVCVLKTAPKAQLRKLVSEMQQTGLLREAGPATQPTGRLSPEFDPARNFGADLL